MASRKWPPQAERFKSKTCQTETGCWEWTGSFFVDGYPQFWFRGTNVKGNRAAWVLFRSEIPQGMQVLHYCDNKRCVNPDHLHLGTHRQNMRESSLRKRHASGSRHYKFKRTPELIAKVKERRANREKVDDIARALGIDRTTVYDCLGKQGRTGRLPAAWYSGSA